MQTLLLLWFYNCDLIIWTKCAEHALTFFFFFADQSFAVVVLLQHSHSWEMHFAWITEFKCTTLHFITADWTAVNAPNLCICSCTAISSALKCSTTSLHCFCTEMNSSEVEIFTSLYWFESTQPLHLYCTVLLPPALEEVGACTLRVNELGDEHWFEPC